MRTPIFILFAAILAVVGVLYYMQEPTQDVPVILLHGWNPTYSPAVALHAMQSMQAELVQLGYADKGVYTASMACEHPGIVVRASYLVAPFTLEVYAGELAKIVDGVKKCTGSAEVDIVAHSMGGIVAREYLKTGSVRKLVMIGSPNNGLYKVNEITEHFPEIDFGQLDAEYVKTLPLALQTYTITGNIDGIGDGLVVDHTIGTHTTVACRHFWLKYPLACKEAFEAVKAALI